jgi:hypothetical protein
LILDVDDDDDIYDNQKNRHRLYMRGPGFKIRNVHVEFVIDNRTAASFAPSLLSPHPSGNHNSNNVSWWLLSGAGFKSMSLDYELLHCRVLVAYYCTD